MADKWKIKKLGLLRKENRSPEVLSGENKEESIQELIDDVESEGIEVLMIEDVQVIENDPVKRPRGWHLRAEYIDSEGKIYHYGKLVE